LNQTTITNCHFPVTDIKEVKSKVLNWIKPFGTFCFLDNHQYSIAPHCEECLAGAGIRRMVRVDEGPALSRLQDFLKEKESWVFGHLAYDLKNEMEDLHSAHPDLTGFPGLFFFEPELLVRRGEAGISIEADEPERVYREIMNTSPDPIASSQPVHVNSRFSREEYVQVIGKLREHILRGDCYEINFCQEFFAEQTVIDPLTVYRELSARSPNPFSALYRVDDSWLFCASPERYLQKKGSRILSQPIKGTSKRNPDDRKLDLQSRQDLSDSAKDRSENVMVVDLVRNDLSRICREGSVRVDELFGIYSFPQVHQMISTVSGELDPQYSFTDIIRATFPMGSMTGAPKKRVMELIETYEKSRRGIFSGALGYIAPGGDFDFNVVIRSIMYHAATGYLSFQAGSGITWYSRAETEWEECLMKAEAIRKVLGEI